jgi:hypothetical protein
MIPRTMPSRRRVATVVAGAAEGPRAVDPTGSGACRPSIRERAAAAGAPRGRQARCGNR